MAREHQVELFGQPAGGRQEGKPCRERKYQIYFAEPENGMDENTGLLLLIAGYGGNARSRVYQKMRRVFADEYNLVTLQCDYLGWEFMQDQFHLFITDGLLRENLTEEEYQLLSEDYSGNKGILAEKILTGYIDLKETAGNYNEMGLWQAMDHLMAARVVLDIMRENGHPCPERRVYAYGQSHGAYLCYLCNFLAPGLFLGIIENSAYLFPYFMDVDREVIVKGEQMTLRKLFHYRVRDLETDRQSYDLERLYQGFQNQAEIVSYHGEEDTMIPLDRKKDFLQHVSGVTLYVVTRDMVDGVVFQSAGHSLGADLLWLFRAAMHDLEANPTERTGDGTFYEQCFETDCYRYRVGWEMGIPLLHVQKKGVEGISSGVC